MERMYDEQPSGMPGPTIAEINAERARLADVPPEWRDYARQYGVAEALERAGVAAPPSGDLTAEDALLAVQVFDAYLILAAAVEHLPGVVTLDDQTRATIKAVREKLRGLL